MDSQAKTMRFPPDLAERLRTAAFVHRRSQTDIVMVAVAEYLDSLETGKRNRGDAE